MTFTSFTFFNGDSSGVVFSFDVDERMDIDDVIMFPIFRLLLIEFSHTL